MNKNIRNLLVRWYKQYKRDLPWRDTSDPYIIWISEIILQQTRVIQGYDYFERFIAKFPNINLLAEADEQDVLKIWQGLGYYSRARNLHTAAKDIMSRFGGEFPKNHADVLSLKGIGDYTAAAIVSFAYNQPYAVLDGNVFRVLSRLYAISEPIDTGKGKKLFSEIAQDLLDKENPNIYNQAIMELGALQCVPQNPICENCPLVAHCLAYASKSVSEYPVKQGKTLVKNRYFSYLDIRDGEYTYISKRSKNDIWKNLYEYPLIESDEALSLESLLRNSQFVNLFGNTKLKINLTSQVKHVLSHRIINANFYKVEIVENMSDNADFSKILFDELHDYPVSRLMNKYIETIINE